MTQEQRLARAELLAALFVVPAIPLLTGLLSRFVSAYTAGLIAASSNGLVLAFLKWRVHRSKQPEERLSEAVHNKDYRSPLVVVLYVVVALQVFQFLASFLVGVGVGAALGPVAVPALAIQDFALTVAAFVVVPMEVVLLVPLSRSAAHRIRAHRFEWLLLALLLNLTVNTLTAALLQGWAAPQSLEMWLVLLAIYAVFAVAVGVGVVWANRTEGFHRMGRAYLALQPPDRRALVELALAELPRIAEPP